MKKLVIFDLDGTLLDTSPGIIACYNETAEHYGFPAQKYKNRFQGIIGGTLKTGFSELYGMGEDMLDAAVAHYRGLYNEKGMYMYDFYPGIAELLEALKQSGVKTAVATLKFERYAKDMLLHAGFGGFIGETFGEDGSGLTKLQVLRKAMEHYAALPQDSVLVGDSLYDSEGAGQAGMDFLAVTYGWGFTDRQDAEKAYHTAIAGSAAEAADFLGVRI
jgi:phosphoglycolate phosphatase